MSSAELTVNGLQTIEANDIECDNLTVFQDLTVFGNQNFIGNLSVSGTLSGITANFRTINNTGTITTSGLVVQNNVQVAGTGNFNNISITGKLDMSDTTNSKKIVMFDSFNDTHQYYGFGVNPFVSRYQVANTGANHIFYGGHAAGSITYASIGSTQTSFSQNLTTSGLNVSNNVSIRGNLSVSGTITTSGLFVSNSVQLGGNLTMTGALNGITANFTTINNTGSITTSGITVSNTVSCNFLQTNSINSNYIFNSGLMEAGNITLDTQWVKNELNFVDNLLLDPPLGTLRYNANQLQYNITDPTLLQNLSHRFRINSNDQFIISSGNAQFNGSVNIATTASAQYFSGNGGGLTGLNVLSISGVLPVNRGGTNSSILTANKIMVGNGTGTVLTPAGLHWDNGNNRLGLLTATPNSTVDIAGTLQVSGVVAFANNLTVSGNATFGSSVSASGLSISNNSIMSGSLIVSNNSTFGQNISTSGLFVSNNGLVRGTLLVSGNATFGSSLSSSGLFVSNNTLMNGTLIVGGNATFGQNLSMSGLRVSNNASITGTLIVQGNATFGSSLSTSGLFVSQNGTIVGSLLVQGNTTFGSLLGVSGLNVSFRSGLNNLVVSGVATFNSFVKIIATAQANFVGTNRGQLAIDNSGGLTFTEAMISLKQFTTTTNQYDIGVGQAGQFVIDRHSPLDSINTIVSIDSNDIGSTNELYVNGRIDAQPASQSIQTPLYVESNWNGTNAIVAQFNNTFNARDAWITIQNKNTGTGTFRNTMKIGVDASGDLGIEDKNNVRLLQFDTSGYCHLNDGVYIAANATAFPTGGGGIGKGIFMKYSTVGTQDQAYIQSINRTNSQRFPLVIQSNQTWLGGDRNASAIIPAAINVNGTADNFGMTGANMNFYTSASNYSGLSIMNYNNRNIFMGFDSYYDGGAFFRASTTGGNYEIYKLGTELQFGYNNATTLGATYIRKTAMTINNNGTIKIGNPALGQFGYVVISDTVNTFYGAGYGYLYNANPPAIVGGAANYLVNLHCPNVVAAQAFVAFSDRRIKKDIEDLKDDECLSLLRQLKPCKYKYIDTLQRGSDYALGFIAQEVEEVFPQAVKKNKGLVPNIYTKGYIQNSHILNQPTLEGKKVMFYNIDNLNMIKIVGTGGYLDMNETEKGQFDNQEVWIYGEEVDDFHQLDKNALIAPIVSAVQELDRKVDALGGADVSTLLEENRILKARLDSLEEKLRKAFVI